MGPQPGNRNRNFRRSRLCGGRRERNRSARCGRLCTRAAQEPTHDAALAWELDEIEQLIAQAHFRVARSLAQSTRGRLRSAALPVQPAQQARLEVLAATAAIAMNRADEARERMRAALRADSGLTLDVSTRSPKVVAVFEATRAALAADSAPQDPEP